MENSFINLLQEKTAWVFLMSVTNEKSDRHFNDLMLGFDAIKAGVNRKNMYLFVETDEECSKLNIFLKNDFSLGKKGNLNDFLLLPTKELSNYQNIIYFVLGHGSINGLKMSSDHFLTPFMLINKIQSINNRNNSIIFMGQCYAGIFKHLKINEKLSIIGSNNLESSLSSSISYNNIVWSCNLFYLYLFNWFLKPEDIDGDGYCSILDSYKYSIVNMNKDINKIAALSLQSYISMTKDKEKLENQLNKLNNQDNKISDELLTYESDIDWNSKSRNLYEKSKKILENIKIKKNEIENLKIKMETELNYLTFKQNPWIINPENTRNLYFKVENS